MKRLTSVLGLLFFVAYAALYAASPFSVALHFRDKQVYRFKGAPVNLSVTVNNSGVQPHSFQLASEKYLNLKVTVTSINGLELPPSRYVVFKKSQMAPQLYRSVTLYPGESFSYNFKLSDFVSIASPGFYLVHVDFTFDLVSRQQHISSNLLRLSIRPKEATQHSVVWKLDEAGNILKAVDLPPDKVVSYMLTARQHGSWTKFFLYLNIGRLMLIDPVQREIYNRKTTLEQERMLSDYKDKIEKASAERELGKFPSNFEVLRTSYTRKVATVVVKETFRISQTYTQIRLYTYKLERQSGYWSVVGYSIEKTGVV